MNPYCTRADTVMHPTRNPTSPACVRGILLERILVE